MKCLDSLAVYVREEKVEKAAIGLIGSLARIGKGGGGTYMHKGRYTLIQLRGRKMRNILGIDKESYYGLKRGLRLYGLGS